METFARTFPDGFLWGAATASYQIEGAHDEDGRSPSIWDTFSRTPGKVANGDTGDVACDHYHRMPQDVALMKDLGLDAYRFSVAWPRVIPDGTGAVNPKGLDFYSRLVDTLLDNEIRPVVTLYHWDLPQALDDRGGWLARDAADWFTEYAAAVVGGLGDRVHHWTTFNEPWCSSVLSYAIGAHAPGHHDPVEAMVAAHHLMLAHGAAVPVVREQAPGAEVSITLNPTQVWGPEDGDEADADAVRRADNALNGLFFGPIFSGAYPDRFLDDTAHLTDHAFIHDGDLATIAAPLDNLGVNNYFPTRVRAAREGEDVTNPMPGCEGVVDAGPRPPLTDMGWEQSPESHRLILERSARESRATHLRHRERLRVAGRRVRRRARPRPRPGRLPPGAPRSRRRRHRGWRRRAGLLRLVAARQLRVGLRLRQALRHRARRLRHPGPHRQGLGSRVRPDHRRCARLLTGG